MSINITPSTDSDSEVNVGDDILLEWVLDSDEATSDITLTIQADSGEITKTGGDLTKVDNGDGTYSYKYTHELDKKYTEGSWDLSGSANAHDDWYITTQ